MMAVTLVVPFITQLGIGGHVSRTYADAVKGVVHGTHDDPTGCWYASVCMVGYFFEAGPRQGIPELYKRALGGGQLGHYATGSDPANRLAANHHDLLAKRERLAPVPNCETAHIYTLVELEQLLNAGGPIFLYWTKSHGGSSYGHASVVIGVDIANVIYHDPEKAPDSKMTIDKFNIVRQQWKYALMQRKS
jgi:hypothetical protein